MKRISLTIATALMGMILLCGFSCNSQKVATASDSVAHALIQADSAAKQAVTAGVMTQADEEFFHGFLVDIAKAGQDMDNAIAAGADAATLTQKVNVFLDAFDALEQGGLIGIKDPNTKLAISTLVTGAETSVSIIGLAYGGK